MINPINDTALSNTAAGILPSSLISGIAQQVTQELDVNQVISNAIQDRDINLTAINVEGPIFAVNIDQPSLLQR